MEGEYDVYFGRQAVGTLQVRRQGLYYRVRCRCSLPGDAVCRLIFRTGEREESLGVPVPEGGVYVLEKMVPIKRFGEERPEFFLTSGRETRRGIFVPLCPEEPFRYIERLKDAYLEERNGRTGVVIPDASHKKGVG